MGLFGNLANARARVLDSEDQQASKDQARNDAIRQKMLEMALQIRGQNETGRHNLAGETQATNQFGEASRHNQVTEGATATGQAETGRHNTVEERIAQMREAREAAAANRPSYTFGTAGVDPNTGQPTVYRGNSRTGELTSTGIEKPAAAGGVGGQNASQMAAAKANMESAMKTMEDYEAKLKQNPNLFGTLDAAQGALSSSPTAITVQHPWDIPTSLLANAASSRLQEHNPELVKYLTAKKFVAEAILNTHKRPNQTQYEIEQEIGGVGPNPSPMQIDMVAQRRKRMYEEVFATPQGNQPSKTSEAMKTKNLAPLTQAQRVRAAADSEYRDFKISQGYKF